MLHEKLKPCPFCGDEAVIIRLGTERQSCIVQCSGCGCKLETPEEYERSGSMWNIRYGDIVDKPHIFKTSGGN